MENLPGIAIFVAVVDAGSFTAAAARLQMTKGAISRQVGQLEERLRTRLLHRTTRRLALTDAGRALYDRASQALRELQDAERELLLRQSEPAGRLVVGAPMSFGVLHVAPALPAFRTRYPNVQIELRLDDRQVDLLGEGIDVAVRIGRLAESSLVARRLAVVRHVLVAAPSYLARHGTPVRPEDLAQHECLVYTLRSHAARWSFTDDAGETVQVNVQGHLQVNNSLVVREMLIAGAGLTLIPTFVVARDLAAGRLQRLLADRRTLELGLHAVYPTRRHVSPAVRAFVEFLEAHIGAPPYWERADAGAAAARGVVSAPVAG